MKLEDKLRKLLAKKIINDILCPYCHKKSLVQISLRRYLCLECDFTFNPKNINLFSFKKLLLLRFEDSIALYHYHLKQARYYRKIINLVNDDLIKEIVIKLL